MESLFTYEREVECRNSVCEDLDDGLSWDRYDPRTDRVYTSVDCEFDDTYLPFRVYNQRVRGFFDTEPGS